MADAKENTKGPISAAHRTEIAEMSAAGKSTAEIARKMKRTEAAILSVLNGGAPSTRKGKARGSDDSKQMNDLHRALTKKELGKEAEKADVLYAHLGKSIVQGLKGDDLHKRVAELVHGAGVRVDVLQALVGKELAKDYLSDK